MTLRRLLVLVATTLSAVAVLAAAAIAVPRVVTHVRHARAEAAADRTSRHELAAELPAKRALRAVVMPAGLHACARFPHALQDWSEICWEGAGSTLPTTAAVRRALEHLGVTGIWEHCERTNSGLPMCNVQGDLAGRRVGVAVAPMGWDDKRRAWRGVAVHGGVELFVTDRRTWHVPQGSTPIPLPAG